MCQADDTAGCEDGVAPDGALHLSDGDGAESHEAFVHRMEAAVYRDGPFAMDITDARRLVEIAKGLTVLSPEAWENFVDALDGPNDKIIEMRQRYEVVRSAQQSQSPIEEATSVADTVPAASEQGESPDGDRSDAE